jgi:L-ribulose-5-phosphate 3-epimerase
MRDAMNRREFLKAGAAVAAAAVVPSAMLADAPKRKLHKAMMYGTLTYPGTVLEQFTALKSAGFEGVEPMSHMKRDEVLKALDKSGWKAASCCCATHWSKPFSDPRASVRAEGLKGLVHALEDAHHYGATSVLLVPGVVGKNVSYKQCWDRSIKEIHKAIPKAEKLNVKIAIEDVWNNFITKPEQAVEYLDAIGSPQVGWHFDIGNTIRYSPPETWIPVLGKRILKLHVKEYSKEKAAREHNLGAGFSVRLLEGSNNWPAIMKALDKVGYHGWGISEQPGNQSRDEAALKDLSTRMSRIFSM